MYFVRHYIGLWGCSPRPTVKCCIFQVAIGLEPTLTWKMQPWTITIMWNTCTTPYGYVLWPKMTCIFPGWSLSRFFLRKKYSEFEDKFLLRAQSYRRTWHYWQTQQHRWFRACSKGTLHGVFAGTQLFVCVTTPKPRWKVSSPWAGLWLASQKCLHMTQSYLQGTE